MNVIPEVSCDCHSSCEAIKPKRQEHLKEAVALEYLTVGWNIIEGVIAVSATAPRLQRNFDKLAEYSNTGLSQHLQRRWPVLLN